MKSSEAMNNTSAAAVPNTRNGVSSETPSELGLIKIHDNVLAALVSRAVLGVEGISRLAGSVIIDNLAGMVGSHSRAIEIVKESDGNLRIVVKVNVYFDTVIPEVAIAVQQRVIEQVESAAGVSVAAVDVVIQQIDEEFDEVEDEDTVDAISAGQVALNSIPGMN